MTRNTNRSMLRSLASAVLLLTSATAVAEVHIPPAPLPPLPATAALDPAVEANINAKGYHVGEIAEDVFWITDGNYHSLLIVTPRGAVLVDAPEPLPFFGPMPVLPAIAEVTDHPVTHMIYSHAHTDHIGGAGAIKAAFPDVRIIAQEETRDILERAGDPRRPVPDTVFRNTRSLAIGGKRIELHYFGNTHERGNIFVYLPEPKILMAVDIVYPGWVPFRRLALSSDIGGWISGHDDILSFDFDILVSGHLTRLGNRDDVILAKEYVDDIRSSIEDIYLDANVLFAAIGAINQEHDPDNDFMGFFAFQTVAKWALFSAFYDFSTQHCAEVLDAKYRSDMGPDPSKHLGGAETFDFSNCEAYFVARRLGIEQ